MKAVILAAGRGRRMGNLTKDLPKLLVQIKERPFLYFLIKNIHAAGINSIGIVVGHKKEKIAEFVKKHGINPILIEQKKPLGTGDAVKAAEKFAGSDSIIVLNGDSIYSAEDIKRIMRDDKYCYVAGLESKHPERYGVIINRDDSVVKIIEKPEIFAGNMINTGIYRFTSEIFDALKKIKLSPRGEYEITDAVNLLAKQNKMKMIRLKDKLLDLTSPDDIERIKEELHHVVDSQFI